MIQLQINKVSETIRPSSIGELRGYLQRALQPGHVISVLRVNGLEIAEERLGEFEPDAIRTLEVQTALPADLAWESLTETQEWIERICAVLDSIAQDYRLGREHEGASRLVSVVDALQVLVGLLQGIHASLDLDQGTRGRIAVPWQDAESELKLSVEGLVQDLEQGDPERLADRTGYALPRSLGRFRDVLAEISA
ncbi:MAG: hypothetical protein E2O73_01300 [Deltaproteobacteria bacterium]|nr:MAG: hypothetical protein E2O73_01300 [Deltaproteobacteria bacterium]